MSPIANTASIADKALRTLLLLTASTVIGIFGATAGLWPSVIGAVRLLLLL